MLLVARVLGGDADSGLSGNSDGVDDGKNGKAMMVTVVLKVAVAIARTATVPIVALPTVPIAKPTANALMARDGEDVGSVVEEKGWTRRHGGAEATAELAADAVDDTIGGTACAVGGDTLGIGAGSSAEQSTWTVQLRVELGDVPGHVADGAAVDNAADTAITTADRRVPTGVAAGSQVDSADPAGAATQARRPCCR